MSRIHPILGLFGALALWNGVGCAYRAMPQTGRTTSTHTEREDEISEATPPRHPRSCERENERHEMVRSQIARRGLRTPCVLKAMRDVPRHWFVPASQQPDAYADRPLPIGEGQTISQPYIVALMTDLLDVGPDDRVLEIGTGSGYQAAILSELVGEVYTIEIVESLGRQAAQAFEQHGYTNIHSRVGDGHRGWPEQAPFDAIIVTCAPDAIPQPLVEQLAPGGRLCIPVGPNDNRGQQLIVVTRKPDGSLEQDIKAAVRFVPMTGQAAD